MKTYLYLPILALSGAFLLAGCGGGGGGGAPAVAVQPPPPPPPPPPAGKGSMSAEATQGNNFAIDFFGADFRGVCEDSAGAACELGSPTDGVTFTTSGTSFTASVPEQSTSMPVTITGTAPNGDELSVRLFANKVSDPMFHHSKFVSLEEFDTTQINIIGWDETAQTLDRSQNGGENDCLKGGESQNSITTLPGQTESLDENLAFAQPTESGRIPCSVSMKILVQIGTAEAEDMPMLSLIALDDKLVGLPRDGGGFHATVYGLGLDARVEVGAEYCVTEEFAFSPATDGRTDADGNPVNDLHIGPSCVTVQGVGVAYQSADFSEFYSDCNHFTFEADITLEGALLSGLESFESYVCRGGVEGSFLAYYGRVDDGAVSQKIYGLPEAQKPTVSFDDDRSRIWVRKQSDA